MDHNARAVEFGADHRLDLAGAYSVLLGIMSPEQARAARVAELLVKSHGVSREVAAKVAAGSLSPKQARAMAAAPPGHPPGRRPTPTTSSLQLRIVAGVSGTLAVIVFTMFLYAWEAEVRQAPPATTVAAEPLAATSQPMTASRRVEPVSRRRLGTDVVFDDAGRLVKVTASNPQDVLAVFCAETAQGRQPVELASTPLGQRNVWFGVFRDFKDLSQLYAVSIHKDRRTRRWSAGDGSRPLRAVPIDPTRLGDRRVAVDGR
jgi:hypothetical protein